MCRSFWRRGTGRPPAPFWRGFGCPASALYSAEHYYALCSNRQIIRATSISSTIYVGVLLLVCAGYPKAGREIQRRRLLRIHTHGRIDKAHVAMILIISCVNFSLKLPQGACPRNMTRSSVVPEYALVLCILVTPSDVAPVGTNPRY